MSIAIHFFVWLRHYFMRALKRFIMSGHCLYFTLLIAAIHADIDLLRYHKMLKIWTCCFWEQVLLIGST